MSDQSNKNGDSSPKPRPLEQAPAPSQPEIIPPALDSALQRAGIDTRDPQVFRALEISLTMMVSGSLPLPPPQILQEYKSISPALVEKFVEWTELQSAHRRELERTGTERAERRFDRGQWIAATVATGGLLLAAVVGIFGNPWVAGMIAIVAVGGPTAAIWLARGVPKAPALPPPPRPPSARRQ
jgi:uncharacterized membrane protein